MATPLPSFFTQRAYVLETFNFAQVLKVMDALDWKWATANGSARPTIEDMKATVDRLLDVVYQNMEGTLRPYYVAGTGGFEVTGWRMDEGILYEVTFYVTQKDGRWAG